MGPDPKALLADKACPERVEGACPERVEGAMMPIASAAIDLAARNIEAVIPGKSNRRMKIEHDPKLYKARNQIERFFGRLKINRTIATRYDPLAESVLSMTHITAPKYCLKFAHAA